jgi:hypothetical protein
VVTSVTTGASVLRMDSHQLTQLADEIGPTIARLTPPGINYLLVVWDDAGDDAGAYGVASNADAPSLAARAASMRRAASPASSSSSSTGLCHVGRSEPGPRCCLAAGHDGGHMYKCAGPSCPGLTWPVSVMPHPYTCAKPPAAESLLDWEPSDANTREGSK